MRSMFFYGGAYSLFLRRRFSIEHEQEMTRETLKSKWVWYGNTTITHCRPTHGTVRKSHRTFTVTRYPQDNKGKEISSLPLQDDCKTRKDTHASQNKDKHRTPEPPPPKQCEIHWTTTEPTPLNGQQPKLPGDWGCLIHFTGATSSSQILLLFV